MVSFSRVDSLRNSSHAACIMFYDEHISRFMQKRTVSVLKASKRITHHLNAGQNLKTFRSLHVQKRYHKPT